MKSALDELSPTRIKMTVEVPFEELKPSIDEAIRHIGEHVQVPGFRKGKVPARIIEQRVGRAAVMEEAVNNALPQLYGQALEEHDVRPLGQPEVSDLTVPMTEGDDFSFVVEVDRRPQIELPDFSDVTITVDPAQASDEDVQTRLDALRARFGTLTTVDRAVQDGDFVSIDLSAQIDGESIDEVNGISYEVGSGNMLAGMDEALIGMSVDESKQFSAPLAGGDREGQDAECTVKVVSVKERELPEMDDDFAQMASEFDTMDELRADVTQQAQNAAKFAQGVEARDKLLEAMLEKVEVPVPDGIVEAEVHSHLEGEGRLEDAEHRAEVDTNTRKALATQLLLDVIAEKHEVQVSQRELIEFLVMTAQQYGMDPNQLAQQMDQDGQIQGMVAEVARRKALATVLEQVKVVDTEGVEVDLTEAVPGTEDDEAADDAFADAEPQDEQADESVDSADTDADADADADEPSAKA